MRSKTVRLAVLVSHAIQYFSPVFRELAKQPGVELTVLYCSRHGLTERRDEKFGVAFAWDIPLLEGYRYEFLPGILTDASPRGLFSLCNPGIVAELFARRYDALLVYGYSYLTNWLGFLAARPSSTRLLLRGESHLLNRRPAWRRAVKAVPLRILFRSLDGYLAIGSESARYAGYYGVPEPRVFFAPYCVDNEFFATGARRGARKRAAILRTLDLEPDVFVFAFFGKLYPRKAPFDLLSAFQRLGLDRTALLFVGDGASRQQLEQYVASRSIPNVRFTGFLNQSDIPRYYGITDVLVLPSREEPWGLVVNEAMASACAVVVSSACGCAADLVRDGENGRVFPAGNITALADLLGELAVDPERVRTMGQVSSDIIKDWTPEICARQIADAVKKTCT